MDFASSTRAAENRIRWKGIVANSSMEPRRHSKVMGQNRNSLKHHSKIKFEILFSQHYFLLHWPKYLKEQMIFSHRHYSSAARKFDRHWPRLSHPFAAF